MTDTLPPELQALDDALAANGRDAEALIDGLTEEHGAWRPAPDAWSVAECLDHLAVANRVYLAAMREAALRARERGRLRRGPARPGVVGRWFVGQVELPARPPRFRVRAPRKIQPRSAVSLAAAWADFSTHHRDAVAFLHESADLDLAGVRFANPFVPGVRFNLATGLHVIPAHERRHLAQAWRARRTAEGRSGGG